MLAAMLNIREYKWFMCYLYIFNVYIPLLGSLPELRKVVISFVMFACPAVRMEHLGSHTTDFHEILFFYHIAKIRLEISSFI